MKKKSFYYVAPQISFIKRQAGFLDGIMYVSAGIGYVNYRSKGTISQLENYNTTCSTVGGNMGIAYEYAFDSRLGIRLGVNCLYAKIKGLHKNTSIGELSIHPREKFHLIVPSLEIGLSYYIVQW
ncbi:hypothetical protein ACMSDR_21615 [Bacteroides thetaiotaomicron]|uniref:hypothetical protein n=1 Tax=Bacteroides thetaiotaomicron TaxID=818 RepID=UPI0039C3E675